MANNFENGGNPFNQNFQNNSTSNFQNPNYFTQGTQNAQNNFQNNQPFNYQPDFMPNYMPYNFSGMNRVINNQMQRSDFQQANNQMQNQNINQVKKEFPWKNVNSIEDINNIRCEKGDREWFMFNDIPVFGIKTINEGKSGNGINNAGLVDVKFFNFSEIKIDDVSKMLQSNFDNAKSQQDENQVENKNSVGENNFYEKMMGTLQDIQDRLAKIENTKEVKNNGESIKRTNSSAKRKSTAGTAGASSTADGTDISEDG